MDVNNAERALTAEMELLLAQVVQTEKFQKQDHHQLKIANMVTFLNHGLLVRSVVRLM